MSLLLLMSNSKTKNVPIIDCEGNAIQHDVAVNCYDDVGGGGSGSCSIENHEYARSHYQSHRLLMLFVVVAVLLLTLTLTLTLTTDEWHGRD